MASIVMVYIVMAYAIMADVVMALANPVMNTHDLRDKKNTLAIVPCYILVIITH